MGQRSRDASAFRQSGAAGRAGAWTVIKPRSRPLPGAELRLDELLAAAKRDGVKAFSGLKRKKQLAAFLGSVMEYSPFLRGLMLDDPARLAGLLDADPKASLQRIVDGAAASWKAEDQAELMRAPPPRAAGAGAARRRSPISAASGTSSR